MAGLVGRVAVSDDPDFTWTMKERPTTATIPTAIAKKPAPRRHDTRSPKNNTPLSAESAMLVPLQSA